MVSRGLYYRASAKRQIHAAKAMFPDYDYVNLENPETRKAAIDDPVGFIRQRPSKLIVMKLNMLLICSP